MWKQIGRLVGWFTKWNATSAQPPLSAHAALEEMRSLLVKVELELRMYDQQRSSLIESCRSMREEVEAMIMESLDGHSLRISPANESLCEAPSCSPKLLPAASRMISEMYSEVKRLETSIMVRRDALDAKRAKAEIQARYLRASVRTTSNALQEGAAALGIPLANFPIDSGDSSPSSSRPTPPLSTPTHSQGATDPGTTSIFFISSEQYSVVP